MAHEFFQNPAILEILERSEKAKESMDKNSNLYKMLNIIDLIIYTITEDPTTTIEMLPVDFSIFNQSEGTSGGGLSVEAVKEAFPVLDKLSLDESGNLCFDGKVIVSSSSDETISPQDLFFYR